MSHRWPGFREALSRGVLDHVAAVLSDTRSGDAETQRQIFAEAERMAQTLLTFLQIAGSPEFGPVVRRLALMVARGYLRTIPRELMPLFLQSYGELFMALVAGGDAALFSPATILLADLVRSFGGGFFPALTEIILRMLADPARAGPALDAMVALSEAWPDFPLAWAEALPAFIGPPFTGSRQCSDALAVTRALMQRGGRLKYPVPS